MASSSSHRRSKNAKKAPVLAPQCILGICLVIAGLSLFVVGIVTPHSVDPLAATTPGSFSRASTWYVLGGILIALTGFILAVFGMRTSNLRR